MAIEQSIIQQARRADLANYLIARGEPLARDGKGYYHKIHDSIKIYNNMYCWNSKGSKGNSLSFLQEFYNMPFLEAIKELTGEQSRQVVPLVAQNQAARILVMPDKADNVKRVIAYLLQTRRINKPALKLCFDQHLIYQDTNGNTVFRMTNDIGEVVGAEIRGTGQQPFKGIAAGSKLGYGFNIKLGAELNRMIVFESSIDLLSFITLNYEKLNGRLLVSMAGLKEQTLINMAKLHNIPLNKVCCCVDQDGAGRQFADDMRGKHGTNTYLPPIELNVKDWNEMLTRSIIK